MIISGLTLLFILNWSLTLIVLASAPVVALITFFLGRKNERVTTAALDVQAKATSFSEECLGGGINTVATSGMREFEIVRYSKATLKALRLYVFLAKLDGVGQWSFSLSFNVVVIAAMYYSGLQVEEQKSSVQATGKKKGENFAFKEICSFLLCFSHFPIDHVRFDDGAGAATGGFLCNICNGWRSEANCASHCVG